MKHSANVKKEKSLLPSSVPRTDTLACIMQMCKDTFSTTEAFIRSVEATPEPMSVLSTDQQLYNMEQFCTQSPSFD